MSKKEAILSAALELLVEKGVHNTPMSQVAKAAGTGMGTIYNYFPNKEVLINEIYLEIKAEEEALFLNVDTSKPIKTQFINYMTVLLGFYKSNSSYFQFMEQLKASPIITEENKKKGGKTVDMVTVLLKQGQKEELIKQITIEEIVVFIGGALTSYLRWYFNQEEEVTTSFTNQIQMVWDAIRA